VVLLYRQLHDRVMSLCRLLPPSLPGVGVRVQDTRQRSFPFPIPFPFRRACHPASAPVSVSVCPQGAQRPSRGTSRDHPDF
jgi:hypothetical protein